MNSLEAVHALMTDATLSADLLALIPADRIHYFHAPPGTAEPYMTLELETISYGERVHKGTSGAANAVVRCNIIDVTPMAAADIAFKLIEVANGYIGTLTSDGATLKIEAAHVESVDSLFVPIPEGQSEPDVYGLTASIRIRHRDPATHRSNIN